MPETLFRQHFIFDKICDFSVKKKKMFIGYEENCKKLVFMKYKQVDSWYRLKFLATLSINIRKPVEKLKNPLLKVPVLYISEHAL